MVLSLTLVVAGCARPGPGANRKTVLTSVTPLGSIMRNVVGDRFDVLSLATPRLVASGRLAPPGRLEIDALEANAAGAVFMGTFDSVMAEAISDTLGNGVPIRLVAELTPAAAAAGDFPWVDPTAAEAIAIEIRNVAASLKPADRGYFDRNLEEFGRALRRVDEVVSNTAASVPAGRRKVAATTESMRSFFERYGYSYLSFASEGGPEALASTMKREQIDVLYVNRFASDVTGVESADVLREGGGSFQGVFFDALLPGPAGSLYHTYFGLLIENARQAFGPLGADLSKLDELRPVDVAP